MIMRTRTFQGSKTESLIYAILSICALIIIWAVLVNFTAMKKIMPNPFTVFNMFFISFVKSIGTHVLPVQILFSLKRVFVGYLLACVIGIPLGLLMGCSKLGNAIIRPIFELIRPIPGLAWIPLAILWFGIDEAPKYFIICISASVSIILNTYSGAREVDDTLLGAAKMLGARSFKLFLNVTLPASVPQIFAGLQVGLSSSWMAVIAAEMIRSSEGSGWVIITGMENGDTVQIIVGMISIGLVGLLLAQMLRAIERRLCSWNVQGR